MPAQRFLRGLVLVSFLAALAVTPSHAASTIGLYTDSNGSSCSFSGNEPGVIDAYVVIRPDAGGVRAVRFSAVPPSCLGAVFVSEDVPDYAKWISDSQTGISVAFYTCQLEPVNALHIVYFRSGSTTPCCEFPIGMDPYVGMIEAVDCNLNSVALTPVVSHFNANASCPCRDGSPPYMAGSPSPQDYALGVGIHEPLSWSPDAGDFDLVEYDVYLGTTATPPLVATVTEPRYQPGAPFQDFTPYYWRVVVRDSEGLERPGPLWTFTSGADNSPPVIPQIKFPLGDETYISVQPQLRWQCVDIDGDPLWYDVYLGLDPAPPLVATVIAQNYMPPQPLDNGALYHWRIVARDPAGHASSTPVYAFTTRPGNAPPLAASNPQPADGSTGVALLTHFTWHGEDPDDAVLRYDVYLGTGPMPPLAGKNLTEPFYEVSTLAPMTDYYWRVVTRDPGGHETSGPTWLFTSGPNHAPSEPMATGPLPGAANVPADAALRWYAEDGDGQALTFDVYFGAESTPPLVATNLPVGSYKPATLEPGTVYYWQVLVRDSYGLATTGPVWSFATESGEALFSRFNAVVDNAAVSVSWQLNRGRSMTDYRIYRSESTGPAVQVCNGVVSQVTGAYLDRDVQPDRRYRYEMRVRTASGTEFRSTMAAVETPALAMGLEPNHPNPFNPQTTIPYRVPSGRGPVHVRLLVYDTAGRTVRVLVNDDQNAGTREVVWNGVDERGTAVSSGVYYCVLQVGSERRTQKMVLLK